MQPFGLNKIKIPRSGDFLVVSRKWLVISVGIYDITSLNKSLSQEVQTEFFAKKFCHPGA